MLKINTTGNVSEVVFDDIQKLDIFNSGIIKASLHQLFDKPHAKVLVNMNGINFLDSSGFAALLSTLKIAKKTDGQIVLCNISDLAMQYFKILQFHLIFNIASTREEGLAMFK